MTVHFYQRLINDWLFLLMATLFLPPFLYVKILRVIGCAIEVFLMTSIISIQGWRFCINYLILFWKDPFLCCNDWLDKLIGITKLNGNSRAIINLATGDRNKIFSNLNLNRRGVEWGPPLTQLLFGIICFYEKLQSGTTNSIKLYFLD